MKPILTLLLIATLSTWVTAQPLQVYKDQLAHTYSIVARDSATGELGVAVQSHWFSVGSLVTWAEAGVGAIATQSFVNPDFGPQGLALLKAGLSANQALSALLAADEGRDVRQVAIVDASGEVAVHTGEKCIQVAEHRTGAGYSAQANMMYHEGVPQAMADAYEQHADQPLAERLLAALEAAEAAGGDIRGSQSAAILVVRAQPTGQVWRDRLVDLRVEDHYNPVGELQRLLQVHRAYNLMNAGDLAMERGDIDQAIKLYGNAEKLFPGNLEMKFWHAVNLANAGKMTDAKALFKQVFAGGKNWRDLLPRIHAVGLLNVSPDALKELMQL